jgi:hypothetical protein
VVLKGISRNIEGVELHRGYHCRQSSLESEGGPKQGKCMIHPTNKPRDCPSDFRVG